MNRYNKAGDSLLLPGILKILIFIVIAPLLGLTLGFLIMLLVYRLCSRSTPRAVDRWFRRLQLVSAALYSSGRLGDKFTVPFWVIISCHMAIALGTLLGGWRVIETLGMKMTKLKPVHGFSAETAAAGSILFSSVIGIPVSTTHTITGAIIGVGATTKLSGIRWGLAIRIVWAWVLTIPGSALLSALFWYGLSLFRPGR